MARAFCGKKKGGLAAAWMSCAFQREKGGQSRQMEIISPGYQKFDGPALGLLSANSY
ncbi:hypothetical protein O9X90_07050 [Agrobacterium leguminum]|jgi:hypothetical protein|uniref:hypothetical protein n=1 Tax=Agrobacterium TaxID=357 RepID=UPI000745A7AE|nr:MULTISPECIES: hypothetical protein [Agrobacterium]KVK41477.1 hypothetical protein L901_11185 [Agrobacterium sp. D14]MCZ7932064.1 hypothetical protein [Agrobacterium leguminum]